MKRWAFALTISIVCIAGLAGATLRPGLVAAPLPKDPPQGAPMTTEQICAIVGEKGELTWANGTLRIKAKKVDGRDLMQAELQSLENGKIEWNLVTQSVRIHKVDREAGTVFLRFDQGKVTKGETEIEYHATQEWMLPAPRQGSKP